MLDCKDASVAFPPLFPGKHNKTKCLRTSCICKVRKDPQGGHPAEHNQQTQQKTPMCLLTLVTENISYDYYVTE